MNLFTASHRMENPDSKCTVPHATPDPAVPLKLGVRAVIARELTEFCSFPEDEQTKATLHSPKT